MTARRDGVDLVYLPNQRGGFDARKWPRDRPYVSPPRTAVARHPLSEAEFALPIAELVKKYPPPAKEGSDAV